ncbi:hypothetical protein RKD33_005825 [Streptomyces sp. SAI-129]
MAFENDNSAVARAHRTRAGRPGRSRLPYPAHPAGGRCGRDVQGTHRSRCHPPPRPHGPALGHSDRQLPRSRRSHLGNRPVTTAPSLEIRALLSSLHGSAATSSAYSTASTPTPCAALCCRPEYRTESALADAVIGATAADAPVAWWPHHLFGEPYLHTLRDVLLHVITETACHAGHLDAERELLDGRRWMVLTCRGPVGDPKGTGIEARLSELGGVAFRDLVRSVAGCHGVGAGIGWVRFTGLPSGSQMWATRCPHGMSLGAPRTESPSASTRAECLVDAVDADAQQDPRHRLGERAEGRTGRGARHGRLSRRVLVR